MALALWAIWRPMRSARQVLMSWLSRNSNSQGSVTNSSAEIVNIGVGKDIEIGELAELVKKVVGFTGELIYDTSKPDGTPRKLVDVGKLKALGWQAKIDLEEGIRTTYSWFLENYQN